MKKLTLINGKQLLPVHKSEASCADRESRPRGTGTREGNRPAGSRSEIYLHYCARIQKHATHDRATHLDLCTMIPTIKHYGIHSSPVAEYHHGQQPKHLDLPAISHAGAAGAAWQAAHSLRSVGAGSRAKVSTASLSVLASSSALRAGRRGSLDASAATRL